MKPDLTPAEWATAAVAAIITTALFILLHHFGLPDLYTGIGLGASWVGVIRVAEQEHAKSDLPHDDKDTK